MVLVCFRVYRGALVLLSLDHSVLLFIGPMISGIAPLLVQTLFAGLLRSCDGTERVVELHRGLCVGR